MEECYWGKEIATLLEIGESTLRKYCIAFEKQGYRFQRGKNESRIFRENDVIFLKRFVALTKQKDVTVEQAISIAMTSKNTTDRTISVLSNPNLLEQVSERLERLESAHNVLLSKVIEQDRYLHQKLEQRDHRLLETIRAMQETSRQRLETAATTKKKWWHRFTPRPRE